jgi:endonuclease I
MLLGLGLLFCSTAIAQIPTNFYSNSTGKSGAALRSALRDIAKTGHVKLPYTSSAFDVWNAYAYTDVRPAPLDSFLWDMYSDKPGGTPNYYFKIYTNQCGTAAAEGDCYSREHCMPNSWWGGLDNAANPQYSDLHQLFPADQYVNNKKSNYPLGQSNSPTWVSSNGCKVGPCSVSGYTGTVFEPINEYKGDFARAYLYMATRYMNEIGNWVKNYPSTESKYLIDTLTYDFKPWILKMLLTWHKNDPVSTKEINRNNAIYYLTPQHNRNPFVDHPEYVCMIWGGTVCAQPPVVSGIVFSNNAPTQSDTVSVSATVTDDGSVASVHLQWGTDSLQLNNTIGLQLMGSNVYKCINPIPAQVASTVYVKITAYDNDGAYTSSAIQKYTISLVTIKAEPSSYPTAFSGKALNLNNFLLEWTDANSGVLPDGYLIKISPSAQAAQVLPVDGVPPSNDSSSVVVLPAYQSKCLLNLNTNQSYYFSIYPFTNSGSQINYKTDGSAPSTSMINLCNCGSKKTAFFESFGKLSTTTSIANHKFSSSQLSFSGSADVRNTSASSGYTNATGNANVFFTNTAGKNFIISGINTSNMKIPTLQFGLYKATLSANAADLLLETSCDGINYTQVSFTLLPTGTGTAKWYSVSTTSALSKCPLLYIRFTQTGSTNSYRIDDVLLFDGSN